MNNKKQVQDMINQHRQLLDNFEQNCLDTIASAAKTLIDCLENSGCIYTCGNGGSAADAQHLATELVGRFRRERKALAAIALNADTSALTAIGNDYGFDQIFARQVEGVVNNGDVLIGFSTSGSSANVLAAVKTARDKGAKILGFTGKQNTPLEELSDQCLCLNGPTSTVQEIHQLAYHILCDLVEAHFAK